MSPRTAAAARTFTRVAVAVAVGVAVTLSGCATSWPSDSVGLRPAPDAGQAVQDGLTAPTTQIHYSTVVVNWAALHRVAEEACTNAMIGDLTGRDWSGEWSGLAAEYDRSQEAIATAGGTPPPGGYPHTVPVWAQTAPGSGTAWCDVTGLLNAAKP
jgi:hypothetical protein